MESKNIPLDVLRYVAFSADPAGGNPAGVVLDATGTDPSVMAATAKAVGFSETAFMVPRSDGSFDVRYFSPRVEVPFCGHATVATAVAYAERHGLGDLLFHTQAEPVRVTTARDADGTLRATLVSPLPRMVPIEPGDLDELLAALRWRVSDLDPGLPPAVAYAGVWHPVIAAATGLGSRISTTTWPRWAPSCAARGGPPSTWCGGRARPCTTRATLSRSAAWSRTRRPGLRPPRSAVSYANTDSPGQEHP